MPLTGVLSRPTTEGVVPPGRCLYVVEGERVVGGPHPPVVPEKKEKAPQILGVCLTFKPDLAKQSRFVFPAASSDDMRKTWYDVRTEAVEFMHLLMRAHARPAVYTFGSACGV